jgi:virulence factor
MAKRKKTRSTRSRKKLRLAFVCGESSAALLHIPGLLTLPNAQITAITALPGTRIPFADRIPGLKVYDGDYVSMIEKEKPDAVYAIISPVNRYDVAATVLDMGYNLFFNKPPALTSEQIRQLDILAQKNNALTGVVFYRRFSPLVRKGKTTCETKGPVHSAVATFYKNSLGKGPYANGGIDALTSDAIHAVDTLRYLCGGEVESVASNVRRLGADYCNTHEALVKFSSGAVGTILTNFMCGRRMFTIEIHSTGISCFADLEEGGRIFADGNTKPTEHLPHLAAEHDPDYYRSFGIGEISIPKSTWHTDVNRHFLDCIRKNKQPETCFSDALKTMELVDAIYRSQI